MRRRGQTESLVDLNSLLPGARFRRVPGGHSVSRTCAVGKLLTERMVMGSLVAC